MNKFIKKEKNKYRFKEEVNREARKKKIPVAQVLLGEGWQAAKGHMGSMFLGSDSRQGHCLIKSCSFQQLE